MSWGFEIGRVYNRRADIHVKFGGQQQGGIITPANHSVVFIITGEEGLVHGYDDRVRPDGVFEYFGEGQVGDMALQKGNRAIAEHSAAGKSLLLFKKTAGGLSFVNEMVYEGHHTEFANDREGTLRQAIVFELRPLEAVIEAIELLKTSTELPLQDLRQKALEAAGSTSTQPKQATRNVYERSRDVRDYVLARANAACEGCKAPAPFQRIDGSPYLEPHHLHRRSDGGPDHPAFVISLCPTCHRRVHFGSDGAEYNATLIGKMSAIEPA
jgi:5-methylcytosine-specific restriction protein A